MAQRFCAQCGATVFDTQQRFCVACGSPLAPDADAAATAGPASTPAASPAATTVNPPVVPGAGAQPNSPADTSGVDRMTNDFGPYGTPNAGVDSHSAPTYPSSTARMPQVAPPPTRMTGPVPAASDSGNRNSGNSAIIAAAVVAVAIILAAVILAVTHPWSAGDSKEPSSAAAPSSSVSSTATQSESTSSTSGPSESTSSSASGSESKSEVTPPAPTISAEDEELYESLVQAYDRMGDYDARIADAAAVFNSTYTSSNSSERQSNSKSAHALREEIQSGLNELKGLSVNANSKYRQSHQTMVQLQQDLFNRIDVICKAWDNSLRYDKPKDHTKEILEPIARDNDGNGVNIYKKDFDAVYPGARPVK
jgi:hypothetical protein